MYTSLTANYFFTHYYKQQCLFVCPLSGLVTGLNWFQFHTVKPERAVIKPRKYVGVFVYTTLQAQRSESKFRLLLI